MLFTAFTLSLVLLQDPAAPLQTQTDTAAPETERAADQAENDEASVICRRETVSGTNRRQRVCMTRAQWQQLQERQREVQTPEGNRPQAQGMK